MVATLLPWLKHCVKAVGVDTIPPRITIQPNMEYHQSTTDEYFNTLSDDIMFDVVFIDC